MHWYAPGSRLHRRAIRQGLRIGAFDRGHVARRRFGRRGGLITLTAFALFLGLILAQATGLISMDDGVGWSHGGFGDTVSGRVTYIRDGDTIEVEGVPIRLKGLVAPERYEFGGSSATVTMRELVNRAGGYLNCELTRETSYDRKVGVCFTQDGYDIAALMVARGVARDCPRYSGGAYRQFETDESRYLPLPDYCR